MRFVYPVTRGAAVGFVVAAVSAVVLAGPSAADPAETSWPPIGEIVSGSAAPGPADSVDTESSLSLGPVPQSSSGFALGSSSGSGYSTIVGSASDTITDAGSRVEVPTPDSGESLSTTVHRVVAETTTPAESFAPDSGSVGTACAGSAVVGSSMTLSGLLTGSSLVPGVIGTGSGGSGIGSAAVGSAVTGSALLTCLLLLPRPPELEIPLRPPALPDAPRMAPPAASAPAAPPPAALPATAPDTPAPPRPRDPPDTAALPEHHRAWSITILMAVLLITVLATARGRVARLR
ncbi:hypothetical protein [Nocardia mexicana]|uniref:MYXO-CTERM domain-containing protein n=1 Tax=Nocardia mexicana TaxID=279262 RepID=A0A370H0X1_9NOCA|nr:hypothetical protein [Nocardia mexicana]RDI49143.1 hypothetical protein DFR68_107271 [Nocardia mexicana]